MARSHISYPRKTFCLPEEVNRNFKLRSFLPTSTRTVGNYSCLDFLLGSVLYIFKNLQFQMPRINAANNVLSNQDLLDGSLLAIILAFLFSFLQGRTPSSSNVKLWPEDRTQNEIGIINNSERIIDKNAVDDIGMYFI